jgi:hypothetical protein
MGNNARNVMITQEKLAEILMDAFHTGNANKLR